VRNLKTENKKQIMERDEKDTRPGQPSQETGAERPRNPFREDEPRVTQEPSEQEVADSEQQHKEALTERD
jgi:hypothetical protein